MTPPLVAQALVWGAADWLLVATAFAVVLLALLAWGYWRAGASRGTRALAGSLKALGVLILVLILLEPLITGTRAKPGANLFAVLADNSQSMTLRDGEGDPTRGERLASVAGPTAKWLAELGRAFDVRQYAFDTQLRPQPDYAAMSFDGSASNLTASLDRLIARYDGRPLAGVLLFTDGTATDADALEQALARHGAGAAGDEAERRVPPIYPVLLADDTAPRDVSVGQVAVSQTNFEDAPVTLTAQVAASGYDADQALTARLVDESGEAVEEQTIGAGAPDEPAVVRFQFRPEQPGVSFYRVEVEPAGDGAAVSAPDATQTGEATLANNARLVAVDRGRGPYRVLYVTGRPNWEFKFLQRAVQSDDQVQLVGLLRIARREPKFDFMARNIDDRNPLFRGFDAAEEQVEQYDQPVLVRLGTLDADELRTGFPRTAEELFEYHAIVLDDLESEFFTQDQMQLIKEFVRDRGGGLLVLGGQESFHNGNFDRTPIGDLLPVYTDTVPDGQQPGRYKLALTREGWLESWVRLRPDERAERTRLGEMPAFKTLNPVRGIKPGATVLARAEPERGGGEAVPALVEQRFGEGRAAALLIGDLWRWGLRRPKDAEDDLGKAWRQTVRWLVADVPRRVEATVEPARDTGDASGAMTISVRVRDDQYAPLDNAIITVSVTGPDGAMLDLPADPSGRKAGVHEAVYVPRRPGGYRAKVTALGPDGQTVGEAEVGWASDPAADEFRDLRPNRALLEQLARQTGGEVVNADDLENFVATLPHRNVEMTEPYIRPAWHTPWVFLVVIACLTAEWGIRRIKGLP